MTTPAFDAWLVVGSPNHVFQDVGFERAFREVRLAAPVAVRVAVEGPAEKLLARKDFCATLTLDDASGGEAYAEIWRRLPKRASRRLDDRSVELAAVIAGDYSLFWKSSPERRDREALRGPLSFDLDARRAGVDLVERFTLDDVARIQSRLGR